MTFLPIFANLMFQDDGGGVFGFLFGGVGMVCWLAFIIIYIVAWWKVYEKAGQPGWAAIIPFYNLYVLMQIAGRPGWWFILYLIPLVNIVVSLLVAIDLGKSFGKDTVFSVLLLWLMLPWAWIGYLMLGFGDATYSGPAAA